MKQEILEAIKKYYPEIENSSLIINNAFEHEDAFVYYSLIRHFKPKRILELGTGFSTRIATEAMRKNGEIRIVTIDENPEKGVLNKEAIYSGKVIFFNRKFESVDFHFVSELEENDILFIDGLHDKKQFEQFREEIHPFLKRGVLVQFHDIDVPTYHTEESDMILDYLDKIGGYEVLYFSRRENKFEMMKFDKYNGVGSSLWLRKN